jgi:anti-sigma factor RsiW
MAAGGTGNTTNRVAIAIAIIAAVGGIIAAALAPNVIVNVNQQGQATAVAQLQPTINALEAQSPQVVEVTREVPVTQQVTGVLQISSGSRRGQGDAGYRADSCPVGLV